MANLVDCKLLVCGLILLLVEMVGALLLVFGEALYHILWKDETAYGVSKLNHSLVLLRLRLGLNDTHQLVIHEGPCELKDQMWE